MDHDILLEEDLECPKHGLTKHTTHVDGHITYCFGPDPDDVPVPPHTEKKVICWKCAEEHWKEYKDESRLPEWRIIQVTELEEEDH